MKRGIVLILMVVVVCSIMNGVVAEEVYIKDGDGKLLLKSEWEALTPAKQGDYEKVTKGPQLKDADKGDLNKRTYWDEIKREIRKDYIEKDTKDALEKIDEIRKLTEFEDFREVLRKKEPWKRVVENKGKVKEVFKDIMKEDYQKDADVTKADFEGSKWEKDNGKDIFNYKGKPIPVENPGFGDEMVLDGDHWAVKSIQPGGTIVDGKLVFNGQVPQGVQAPYPKPNPTGGQPIGGGNPMGGSGGGGIMEKLQGFQQIWGMISQLLGAIPKGGETTANGNNELAIADGAGVYLPEPEAYAEQNCVSGFGAYGECLDKPAVVRIYGDSLLASNTALTVGGQGVIYTPEEPITEVELEGVPEDSPKALAMSSQLTEEYSSPVLAAVISDVSGKQYVRLIQHDLILGGEKILVDVLKSFKDVSGSGSKLWVKNGGMYLKFDGIKIYYSRRIKETPYSFFNIQNELDKEDKFSLIKYMENRGRLINTDGRISVGDKVVQHPRTEGLGIARVRKDMWVER